MSRNEDRMMGQPLAEVDPPASVDPSLFDDDSDLTEFVELPSHGKHYPVGHPYHRKREVELRYPRLKDQEILNNESYVRKGEAIDRVLRRVIVDERMKEDLFHTLLKGDKEALFLQTKIMMHGPFHTVSHCPLCPKKKTTDFDLRKIKPNYANDERYLAKWDIEVSQDEDHGTLFTFPLLQRTNRTVTIRLLTSEDETKLFKYGKMCEERNLKKDETTQLFKLMIVAFSGVKDKSVIYRAIDRLWARDANHILSVSRNVSPGTPLELPYSCDECGKSDPCVKFPYTPDFFWPKQ